MSTLPQPGQWYQVCADLDLYDRPLSGDPDPDRLATQGWAGRFLQLTGPIEADCWPVQLLEDGYGAWLRSGDLAQLEPVATVPDLPPPIAPEAIPPCLAAAIAWVEAAAAVPNQYRWGGTVAPDYDCSGLMQAAFAQTGLWLPRDAYQQEAFLQPLPWDHPHDRSAPPLWHLWQPGDLVFFGPPAKATHVGLYLGEGRYLHSSGRAIGRNGIGLDRLDPKAGPVSRAYFEQLRGAGRIVQSYTPELRSLKVYVRSVRSD